MNKQRPFYYMGLLKGLH